MNSRLRRTSLIALALLAAAGGTLVVAGPLTPPAGPVGPSYKTLTEVEPRIAINQTNTPGSAISLFKITQPGSYYLTGNVTGADGKHGIEVACGGVTLDLGGFELTGAAGSLSGVYASVLNSTGIVVRNGGVRAWGQYGVSLVATKGASVENVTASENYYSGISAGQGTSVRHCTASANQSLGISSSVSFTTVSDCVAIGNASVGISINSGTVSDCLAVQNAGGGISVVSGAVITGCNLENNGGVGISAATACQVRGCTVVTSGDDGIRVNTNTQVIDNTCCNNGTAVAAGAGVHALYSGNRIDSNNVNTNDIGVLCDSADNLVVRNSARGNGTGNYSFPAGSDFGQVLTTPGNAFVASNPWANFAY